MKAAVVTQNGVEIQDIEKPEPKPNEVLVRVRACGLNRADLMVAGGMTHGSTGGAGTIVGMEFSGEVVGVGSEAQGVKEGDRVMCHGTESWAEYAVADWGRTALIPDSNMSFEQAATLPVALYTMHNAIVTNGKLNEGETILIQGASSGVGLMGLQIAKLKGAKLVAGSSTNSVRRGKLKDFGADLAIDSKDPSWPDQLLDATDGKGVNLIVDQLSGYVANDNLKATAITGRIINVGRLGGFKGDFDFDLHAARRIQYIGVTFRTRSIEEIRAITRELREDLGKEIDAGMLSLPIDQSFALDDVNDALEKMKANEHFGKITLIVD
ncbi:MAG: quinone oxidoreductase [Rhodospirillaceae bacterium]|nr:quinone oxidoreductase [Rhodospirillaceae bacterium]|tara:strand:+ start:1843 stop:2817 length:975 start_codon:yes stop_codon:yes gene_type:complete